MKRMLLLLAAALLLEACNDHAPEFDQILQLEDRRAPASEFAPFEMHVDHEVQRRAAIALGRLQDPDAIPMLAKLLESSSPSIRVEAAFAIGQLAEARTCKLLVRHLRDESDLEVRVQLIEALSKTADSSTIAMVDSALLGMLSHDAPIITGEAALALGRLAHRHLSKPHWGGKLAKCLDNESEEVRWRVAYALMRLADSSTAMALRAGLDDRSARVRMQAARGLGNIHDQGAVKSLVRHAWEDPDWRVRVNANTALGECVAKVDPSLLTQTFALTDSNLHVRLAAIQALGQTGKRMRDVAVNGALTPVAELLRVPLSSVDDDRAAVATWQERCAAASALAQVTGRQAITDISSLTNSLNHYERACAARALGETRAVQAFEVLAKMFEDDHLLVKIAVLEALPNSAPPIRTVPIYKQALESGDPVLVAIAARNLAADSSGRVEHADFIIAAYELLQQPVDIEAAEMIFQALADCGNLNAQPLLERALAIEDKPTARAAAGALQQLTGFAYRDRLPRETLPFRTTTYGEIKRNYDSYAEIQSDAGTIILDFYWQEAPVVAYNFVRLAEDGFYDGLAVHRVVPNYVIQAGDPRGDMWGSPGYSIRSQFSRLHYARGMVGMASVGPDTEGCQWFITYSDQPHLDGRYSIFARVRQGMEVVDRLQVGDVIRRVIIHR